MGKKLPKLFRKPLTQDDLDRKVRKKIYLQEYRDALGKLLARDTAGRYRPRADLSKWEALQLKKIAVSVRKNTGFVQKGKLIIVLAVLAAIVVFTFVFKDLLLERAAEAGLESVFGARADVQGLTFQILNGRIAWNRLEVADSGKPMTNLFELGAAEVKINMTELLKNNIRLENVMCRDIRWGTPRKFSGALPGKAATAEAEAGEAPADPLAILSTAGAGAGADAQSLLEKEKADLASLKTLERVAAEYPLKAEKWQKEAAASRAKIDSASAAVKAAAELRVENIKTPADTAAALAVVEKAYRETKAAKEAIDTDYAEFQRDRAAFEKDRKQLDAELKADTARLMDKISAPLGSSRSLISAFLEKFLSRYIGGCARYARQALGYAAALKPQAAPQGGDKAKAEDRTGAKAPAAESGYNFVLFPGSGSPKFWLERAEVSFGVAPGDYVGGTLTDATGEPDAVGRPLVGRFEAKTGPEIVKAEATIDGRTGSAGLLGAKVSLSGHEFVLEEGLAFLNLRRFSAVLDGGVEVSIGKDGRTAGTIAVALKSPVFTKGDGTSEFSNLAYGALARLKEIRVSGSYRARSDGGLDFNVNSNLTDALGRIVMEFAAEKLGEVKVQLQAEFDKLVDEKLGASGKLVKDYAALDKLFQGDFSSLADSDKLLDQKKQEITKAAAGNGLEDLKKQFGF